MRERYQQLRRRTAHLLRRVADGTLVGMKSDGRVLRWSVLCGYLLLAAGVPLPVGRALRGDRLSTAASERAAAKDRSQAFPCMDSPCGCLSADQCFQDCCCHSPAQLLAWANRHDVALDVLRSLELRVAQVEARASVSVAGRQAESDCDLCCQDVGRSKPAIVTCCETSSTEEGEASRGSESGLGVLGDSEFVEPLSGRVLVWEAVRACNGLANEWHAGGTGPLPGVVTVEPLSQTLETVVCLDEVASAAVRCVEPPPPRWG